MDGPSDKKAIVIVEDDEASAELMESLLNDEPDYHAVSVPDAAHALEVIHSFTVNLLLLDVKLPGMDGFELYRKLQEEDATSAIPVIFITADVGNPQLYSLATKNVLKKPFHLEDLLARVAAICRPTSVPSSSSA